MDFNVKEEYWRKIGVYKITNKVNGKIYIGSTTTNFRHRFLQYRSGFNRKLDNQPILYRAFNKYGIDNFTFEIVETCGKEICIEREQFYIDKGTNYNSCLVAGSLLGLVHSPESKTITVIKGDHHCATKVDMYSVEGLFLKSFNSIIEAQNEANVKSKSNITQCCKGICFSAGNYRWTYQGCKLTNRIKRENGTIKTALKKGDFYKEFHSQKETAEYLCSLGYKAGQGRITRSLKSKKGEKVYGFTILKL